MKHFPHKVFPRAVILALLLLALTGRQAFLIAADPEEPALNPNPNWENVSAAFTRQIGADDLERHFFDIARD